MSWRPTPVPLPVDKAVILVRLATLFVNYRMADRMTAVLEPQAAGRTIAVEARDRIHFQQPVPTKPDETDAPTLEMAPAARDMAPTVDLDNPAAPFHCGVAMTAGPVPIASLGWAPLELGSSEWSCTCGYTVDGGPIGDPLESLRLASARVESLQWELDAAQERFENAVRSAAKLGAEREVLGRAAGLSAVELQEFLDCGAQSM